MKCAICLESHPANVRRAAIRCGHVFCEKCLRDYYATRGVDDELLPCPTCRSVFDPSSSDVIPLYLEDDEDVDEVAGSGRPLTDSEKHSAIAISAAAEELGLESAAVDLEAVVSKAEVLLVSLPPAQDVETKEVMSTIEGHLNALRNRLIYAHRLSSLKEENARLVATLDDERASYARLADKYEECKVHYREAATRYNRAKERCKTLSDRDQVLAVKVKEQQVYIKQAEEAHEAERQKMLRQIFNATAAREVALKEADAAQAKAEAEAAKSTKWMKRYYAVKQELGITSKKTKGRSEDDSLEIVSSTPTSDIADRDARKARIRGLIRSMAQRTDMHDRELKLSAKHSDSNVGGSDLEIEALC
ncbi:hypothetical protein FRB99_006902 [Tulasnella sp. 403]|nr:hypothetical protein FRB99_006902 [Tulasnella sp. 403]